MKLNGKHNHMKKTALFLVSVLLVLGGAAGQNGNSTGHFDWAKGYGSAVPNSLSCIKGTVTDSLGNLYILGQFRNDAEWDGERILPMTPYGPDCSPTNVLIAKISPSGEMVWKKVVHGNDGNQAQADDIKPLGDTGFAVMFYFSPHGPNLANTRYLYWLDTLYTSEYYPFNPYQYPDRRFSDVVCNAYVAFDFDGNVKEQHFLERSYVDSAGNDLMWQPYASQDSLPRLRMQYLQYVTFDVDSVGNIYICRQSVDSYGSDYQASEGTLTAVKFWADHRMVGECSLKHRPQEWYPHLLKFSPHFDTLLESRYLVQKTDSLYYTPEFYIKVNKSNLFLVLNMSFYYTSSSSSPRDNTMVFDSVNHVSIFISEKNQLKGFVTVHDLDLTPRSCLHLDDSIINHNDYFSYSWITDIDIDEDSNTIFFSGFAKRNYANNSNATNSLFLFQGTPLSINNNAFVLALDRQSYGLRSTSIFPSKAAANLQAVNNIHGNLKTKNNRIFLQAQYYGGIRIPSGNIDIGNSSSSGLALCVFDYQGHVIDGVDYGTIAIGHYPSSLALSDSTLYLVNHLKADADFGEHHVYAYGDPFVCVAKYTDASFMTPYVYTPQGGGEHVDLTENTPCTLYPNPVRDKLYVSMDEPMVEASVMTLTGIKKQIPFNGNMLDIASLQPGAYILEIVTNQHIYRHKIIKL